MKKFISLFCILLLIISLASCNEGDIQKESKQTEAQSLKDIKIEIGMTEKQVRELLKDRENIGYERFIFFKNSNEENKVVEFDMESLCVKNVQSCPKQTVTKEKFFTIKEGMTPFEVVQMIGLPVGSTTSGMRSLDFDNNDGFRGRVYWNTDMTVQSVKELTENN